MFGEGFIVGHHGYFSYTGQEKSQECAKMIVSLDKLVDEIMNLVAVAEAIDKGDQPQMKKWLENAQKLQDLAIDSQSMGKAAVAKFKNYLSS